MEILCKGSGYGYANGMPLTWIGRRSNVIANMVMKIITMATLSILTRSSSICSLMVISATINSGWLVPEKYICYIATLLLSLNVCQSDPVIGRAFEEGSLNDSWSI